MTDSIAYILTSTITLATLFAAFIVPCIERRTVLLQEHLRAELQAKQSAYSAFSKSHYYFFARFNPQEDMRKETMGKYDAESLENFYEIFSSAHAALVFCNPETAVALNRYIVTIHTFFFAGDGATNAVVNKEFQECIRLMHGEISALHLNLK